MKKYAPLWFASTLVSLYTTFVLQHLWNWFAVPAFNVSSIPYWGAFGLVLGIGILKGSDDKWEREAQMRVLVTITDACVPEEKREEVKEKVDREVELAWAEVILIIVGRVFGNTTTLAIGWGVHAFL